ncbi:hypothetical protein ABMY26_06590 (plasmid) [Azospirillum sp. HJ39]
MHSDPTGTQRSKAAAHAFALTLILLGGGGPLAFAAAHLVLAMLGVL